MNFVLKDTALKLRLKAGTTAAGKDKYTSITVSGIAEAAAADKLDAIGNAIDQLTDRPVIEKIKVTENLIMAE